MEQYAKCAKGLKENNFGQLESLLGMLLSGEFWWKWEMWRLFIWRLQKLRPKGGKQWTQGCATHSESRSRFVPPCPIVPLGKKNELPSGCVMWDSGRPSSQEGRSGFMEGWCVSWAPEDECPGHRSRVRHWRREKSLSWEQLAPREMRLSSGPQLPHL